MILSPAMFPQTWAPVPLKYLLTRRSVKGKGDSRLLSVYRDHGVVLKESRDDNYNKPGKNLDANLFVQRGNLVINKMKAWQGSVAVSDYDGIVSPAYFVFKVDDRVHGRFLHHQLRSSAYIKEFKRLSDGIRPNQWDLDLDEFGRCKANLPPLPTQKAIADFLDCKTTALYALIERKQKLLDLLAEKRAALINQAVTKGLDTNVSMKYSGIPWIGEIPAHWTTTRAKFQSAVISDCLHSTPDYLDDGFPALRTSDVQPGWLDLENARRVDEETLQHRNQRLWPQGGDVIYTREGGRFGIAAPVPTGVQLCLAQRVMLLRPTAKTSPSYLMWVLNSKSVFEQALIETIGAASPRVNMETVANYVVPLPPQDEQEAIGQYLRTMLKQMDDRMDLVHQSQAKLAEYRQALITAAVTGQLDIT